MIINVESKNKKYADYLKECYCGKFSDFSTFLLFKYQHLFFINQDKSFSLNMNKLSNDSLLHLEILGKLITLLGETPDIIMDSNIDQFYINDKSTLLEIDIRLTKEKIILYTKNMERIEDKYIKEILELFIIEERKNLKILEILQLKNKTSKL